MVRSRRSAWRVRRRVVDRRPGAATQRTPFGRRKSGGFVVAALAVVVLASGCTVAVGGTAQPAPVPARQSLAGPTIARVLVGHTTLSQILKQPLITDGRFPRRFGGPEVLQADGSASSLDCLGVAGMLEQAVYHSGQVKDVAIGAWRHLRRPAVLTEVKEGVVSLPSAADAGALFAAFTQQWQHCDGRTQPFSGGLFRLKAMISQVHVAGPVMGATVRVAFASSREDGASVPAARAIGVRGNCLVEVEVDYFNAPDRSPQGPDGIDSSAQDIAQTMMSRISALS